MTEMAAFTIRIPKQLADQIDARAKTNHRRRNQEINMLLERAIDDGVRRDLETIRSFGGRSVAVE